MRRRRSAAWISSPSPITTRSAARSRSAIAPDVHRRLRGHGRVAGYRSVRAPQCARHHAGAARRDSAAARRRAAVDAVSEPAGHLHVAQSRGLRHQRPADRGASGSGAAVGRRSRGDQRHAAAVAESHRDVPRRGDRQAHAWRRRFAHGPRHRTDLDGSAGRAFARGIHAGFARRPGHRRRRARRHAHDDVRHVALRRQFHDRGGDDDGDGSRRTGAATPAPLAASSGCRSCRC